MSSIYCIPNLSQIDKYMNFSKEYNAAFEYNDFFLPCVLDDEDKVNELIEAYCAIDRDRSEDTLHGVFLDICVNSADPLIYKASDKRIHQSMDIAMRLGVKAVIFHTNHIPNFKLKSYQDGWVDLNEKYWRALLKEYPSLSIYMENMFDNEAELLQRLADRMIDEPRFGVCFDIAHAHIGTEALEDWAKDLKPYIRHMHINDNDGLEDTHHPVGSKMLDWSVYQGLIDSMEEKNRPSILIEVRTYEDLEASVAFMKNHHLYPLG